MMNCDTIPIEVDFRLMLILGNDISPELLSTNLVKRNIWLDRYKIGEKSSTMNKINPREIELVPYEEVGMPVVRYEQVFQICVSDWDGDCVLKDDINGVQILKTMFTGDDVYDIGIISYLPTHPMHTIKQIKYQGKIIDGSTLELQLLIDLYYGNFCYI